MNDALMERISELTAEVTIRQAENSVTDADRFVSLFNQQYDRKIDRNYYFWQFFDDDIGHGQCFFAENEDRVVGVYGFRKSIFRYGTDRFVGALAVDEIVTDQFRRLGLVYRLEKVLEDSATRHGCELLYALPNTQGASVKLREMSWSLAGRVAQLSGVANEIPSRSPGLRFEEVPGFNGEPERVMDSFLEFNPETLLVERSSDYLNWRFVRNPLHQYRVFTTWRGSELFGYLVVKVFSDPTTGEKSGDLVDLLYSKPDPEALLDLLSFGISVTRESGAVRNSIFCPDELTAAASVELGLTTCDGAARPLCVKALQEELMDGSDPFAARWYLTMGDSEIY